MPRNIPPADLDIELEQGFERVAVKESSATKGDLFNVPIEAIHVLEGFNLRVTGTEEYEAGIEDIKRSIQTEGFYRDKPLAVYVGKDSEGANTFFLTDGHRRFEALKRAIAEGTDIQKVPVILKPAGTSLEDLTVAMTRTGEPLKPYEWAIACKRLIGFGRDPEEVAKRLGITRRYVDDLLLLIGAPAKIRNMVMADKLAATLAIKQLRSNGRGAVQALTKAATAAAKEGKARVTNRDVRKATPATKPPARDGTIIEDFEIKVKAGDILALDEIKLFQPINGGSWYTLTEKTGKVEITEDIDIKIHVKRRPIALAVEGAEDL